MNNRSNRLVLIISLLGSLLITSTAFAHHAEWMKGKPFIQGLSMPVHGLDHMLVTFAVGLIAVQIGGDALWAGSAAFSLLLLLGGVMNGHRRAVRRACDLCIHHRARWPLGLPQTASPAGRLGC